MLIFVDFETNGLKGEIIEACAIDEKNNLIIKTNNNFNYFFNFILNYKIDNNNPYNIFVFWHNFMPNYLKRNYKDFHNKIEINYLIFNQIFCYINFNKDNKFKLNYTIYEITFYLLKRHHLGMAENDCRDLIECFYKLKERIKYD